MLSPQSVLYALSFYLDIVAPNWSALVEEEANNYLTVIPLTTQAKYTITFLHQPLFCQQLGIFSTKSAISETEVNIIFNSLFQKYPFASHYHFNTQNTKQLHKQQGSNYQISTSHTHHLSLAKPYQSIYQNYSLDRKKNLKRAQKANLTIVESKDINPLLQMFEKDIAHKIKGGVDSYAYDYLKRIYQELDKRNLCKLLYTQTPQGAIHAGALFAFHRNQIIYLFNAAFAYARKENGRMYLIDNILKTYANTDYIFDFESPEIESIAYFYKSFGAEAVSYPILHYNHLPTWINLLWKIKKNISATFSFHNGL